MKISQKTAYIITAVLVFFAILPSSWYVDLYHEIWPLQSSTDSAVVSDGGLWQEIIKQGLVVYKQDRLEDAELKFREALEIADRLYPKIHRRRAKTLRVLGQVLLEQGKPHEAVVLFDEATDINIATLPRGDDKILKSMNMLSGALFHAGDSVRSASIARRLIEVAEEYDKSVNAQVVDALLTLSKCDLENENIQSAKKSYLRVLDIETQLYGKVSVPVLLARFYIAGVAVSLQNIQEVDSQVDACKSIIKSLPKPIKAEEVELIGAFMEALPSIGLAEQAVEIWQLFESLHPDLLAQRDSISQPG